MAAKRRRVTPPEALEQSQTPAPAVIEVPPAPTPPPPEAAATEPQATTPEAAAPVVGTGAPIPPDTAKLALEIAFGIVAAATGEPEIWRATDEELDPLAPAVARQLSRIPLVKAIGPDNSELVVVVAGVGTMTLRRLNEYAAKVQQRRDARNSRARTTAEPISRGSAPLEQAEPRASGGNGEAAAATEGDARWHVGAPFGGATHGGAGPRRV